MILLSSPPDDDHRDYVSGKNRLIHLPGMGTAGSAGKARSAVPWAARNYLLWISSTPVQFSEMPSTMQWLAFPKNSLAVLSSGKISRAL
jgi:hypothetical protein